MILLRIEEHQMQWQTKRTQIEPKATSTLIPQKKRARISVQQEELELPLSPLAHESGDKDPMPPRGSKKFQNMMCLLTYIWRLQSL